MKTTAILLAALAELAKAVYLTAVYEMHHRKGGEPVTRAVYLHRQGWRIDPRLSLTSVGTLPVPRGASHDVCHCGDYRHQHDERGCNVCRSMPTPWSPRCEAFRLTTPTS